MESKKIVEKIDKRTPETISINNKLEIVHLEGKLSFLIDADTCTYPSGYCFWHPEKGYLALKGDASPYRPKGGKAALDSVKEQGGFLSFDNMTWVNPIDQHKVQEYAECMVKNRDFKSVKDFMKNFFSDKESVVDWLKWRALGGTMLHENTPEGYTEACRNLLREVAPEDYKGFEENMKQLEQFKKDLIDNGYRPTENLMSNYIALLEENEKGITDKTSLTEISESFREGSSDKPINDIGKELMNQELLQVEALEACP